MHVEPDKTDNITQSNRGQENELQLNFEPARSTTSSSQVEIQSITPETLPNSRRDDFADLTWLPVLLWGVALFFILKTLELTELKAVFQHFTSLLKRPKAVPCKTCRYLSDNVYLRCAVNPKDVLTEEALQCREYCPRSGEKSTEVKKTHCHH